MILNVYQKYNLRASTMVVPKQGLLKWISRDTSLIYNFLIKVPIKDSMTQMTIH
jgi:hypothetical protein